MSEQAAEAPEIGSELPASSGNPVEDIAKKMGWNPDHGGDDAIDAEEFILNANKIARQASQDANSRADRVAALERQMADQSRATERLMKTFQEQATARAKREMREAVDAGDHARAAEIMDAQQQATQAEAAPEPPADPNAAPREHADAVNNWIQEATWYSSGDAVVRGAADAIFSGAYRPDMSVGEVRQALANVESQVRKELPHKFVGAGTTDVNDASRPAGTRKTARSKHWDKLSATERETAMEFIDNGYGAHLKTKADRQDHYAKMMLGVGDDE